MSCEIKVPGARIVEEAGNGEILELVNDFGSARIALKGAKVLSFIPNGTEDLIGGGTSSDVLSHRGVPVCWPWFGGADKPAHGFVRSEDWELVLLETTAWGGHRAVFSIAPARCADPRGGNFDFDLALSMEIGGSLEIALSMRNRMELSQRIGCALHTYFKVSNIADIRLCGLDGAEYLDYTASGGQRRCVQKGELRFNGEVDWVFDRSMATVDLIDPGFERIVHVEKAGSCSTVVWNPGSELAGRIADLSGDGYKRMVCIEAANALDDVRGMEPGAMHTLSQKISWKRL